MAFDDGGGEDGHDVGGKLADVVGHAQQHPRSAHVLATPEQNTGQRNLFVFHPFLS